MGAQVNYSLLSLFKNSSVQSSKMNFLNITIIAFVGADVEITRRDNWDLGAARYTAIFDLIGIFKFCSKYEVQQQTQISVHFLPVVNKNFTLVFLNIKTLKIGIFFPDE